MNKKKKQSSASNDNNPVTMKEFNERSKKVDERFERLDLAIENQAKAIIETRDLIKVESVKNDNHFRQIITMLDGYSRKTDDLENKAILNTHRINNIEDKIRDYDGRISKLESTIQK